MTQHSEAFQPRHTARQLNSHDNAIQFPAYNADAVGNIVISADQLASIVRAAVSDAIKQTKSTEKEKAYRIKQAHKVAQEILCSEDSDPNFTCDGRPKATAASPIRSGEDFDKICNHLLHNGQELVRIRNYTLFVLGTTLGLRCGDLLRIKVGDVFNEDFSVKTHLEIVEEKTGKRTSNKLTEMAVNALKLYAKRYTSVEMDHPLFRSYNSRDKCSVKPMTYHQAYKIISGAGKSCGIDGHISTHTMRKTYGYSANAAAEQNGTSGETLETLQMKYHHRDQRCTMIYAGIGQDAVDRMADSVDNYLQKKAAQQDEEVSK